MNRTFKEKAAALFCPTFLSTFFFIFDTGFFSSLQNFEVENDSKVQLWISLTYFKVHLHRLFFNAVIYILGISGPTIMINDCHGNFIFGLEFKFLSFCHFLSSFLYAKMFPNTCEFRWKLTSSLIIDK